MKKNILIACLSSVSLCLHAAIETYQFDSIEQEARFRQLGYELRCPKCQNQAIGDSDADISGDLRAEVYRMLKDGATDEEIKEFMVARYGRYVLYNPPLDKHTLVLWFGPAVLLILGGIFVGLRIRKSKKALEAGESQT
ncbi:MAG: cytochrome c-type biogenesis protein [Pseudomonadota bacterium]|nr:cytochrome c-type biogenesis protein [Pseudomonadota bacterium]